MAFTDFASPRPLPAPSALPPPAPERATQPAPVKRISRTRVAAIATVVALTAVSLLLDRGALLAVPLLFAVIVPFEKMFPRHRDQKVRRPEVGTDVAYAIAGPALNVAAVIVGFAIGVASLAWLPGLALRPLVAMIPSMVMPFVGILLFDFAIYWAHRWSHEVPLLWRFHAVHHSTKTLDWVSGFRNHPLDGAILAPPIVLLLAAGFDATFTGVLAVVQIVTGLFLHANVRWRLRPLHRIVITPEFHHWHHANQSEAHNSNYSVFLPIWDIGFGTYFMPKHRRPSVYGISDEMPDTMLGQLRQPLAGSPRPIHLIRVGLRHPFTAIRRLAQFVRSLIADIVASTTRPTNRQHL